MVTWRMDQPTDNENKALAQEMYAEWDEGRGTSKSELERRYWDDGSSHGRRFDRFILENLGIQTSKSSSQTNRIEKLERQIRSLGQHPVGINPTDEEKHLLKGREACLSALRVWNDPTYSFRTGAFSLLFVTAWNNLALAMAMRKGIEWRELNNTGMPIMIDEMAKPLSTSDLTKLVFSSDKDKGVKANIDFWIKLRNSVAHRYIPELDIQVIPEAQAGLLNFETTISDQFGKEYGLAEKLSVPLHLSGFRNPDTYKHRRQVQARLPLDVQSLLSKAEDSPELLKDDTYALRVSFIPFVPASGTSPDVIANFVKPGEVSTELTESLTEYVVLPKLYRAPRPVLRPSDVVKQVQQQIPFRFSTMDHVKVARYLKIRPDKGKPNKSLNEEFCEYLSPYGYLYNQKWVDLVVNEISSAEGYKRATGREPLPKT